MNITIPSNSLIILVGVAGSGKSTFARQFFLPESIISSDACRRLLVHGKTDIVVNEKPLQQYSKGAFMMFYNWIHGRLTHNFYAVADSTAIVPNVRQELEKIAQGEGKNYTYIVFNTPLSECIERDSKRPFPVGESVVKKQYKLFESYLGYFKGLDNSYVLTPETISEGIEISWVEPMKEVETKFKLDSKYVDIIGDVHGCLDELKELLVKLGYSEGEDRLYRHPQQRIFVSVGDIVDRGPNAYNALIFMKKHIEAKLAVMVMGNHENKFARYLVGRNIKVGHGLQATIDQLPSDLDRKALAEFLFANLKPYYLYEYENKTLVAITHAAFKDEFIGFNNKGIQAYCMYGPISGQNEDGKPNRIHWEIDHVGIPVVYGHTVTEDFKPKHGSDTVCIDTGCVFGGALTCLRLPESEFISVPAKKVYFEQ